MIFRSGPAYASVGFGHSSHITVGVHRRWRLCLIQPRGKPGYRRLYIGPFEVEWS